MGGIPILGNLHFILLCDRRLLIGSLDVQAMLKLSVLNRQHDKRNYWQVKPKKVRLKKSTKPNSLHVLSAEGILMRCLSQSSSLSARWDFHQSSRLMCAPGTRPWSGQLCNAIPLDSRRFKDLNFNPSNCVRVSFWFNDYVSYYI